MIIVHNIFVCKPGNASKMAKLFKETMTGEGKNNSIMTDMTGQFHRVIMASNYENLAAYEKDSNKMNEDTPENRAMNEKFKNMNDLYISGSREIFKVW